MVIISLIWFTVWKIAIPSKIMYWYAVDVRAEVYYIGKKWVNRKFPAASPGKVKITTKIVTMAAAKLDVIRYLRNEPQQKFRLSHN